MKHLEPIEKSAEKQRNSRSNRRSWPSGTMLLLLGAVVIAVSGFALSHWIDPLPKDRIEAREKQRLESEFNRIRSVRLVKIEKPEEDVVLDTMKLDPISRQQLKRTIAQGAGGNETTLAWVSLWDFAAQDGDVVVLSSSGYSVTVPLEKRPNDLAVPVDSSRQIKVTGARDGGGGITLAVKNGAGFISMPVLEEGQSLTIPVGF